MSDHFPRYGGVSGNRFQIDKVSWRNGSSGSGAKYNTSIGNRRIALSENWIGSKRAKQSRSLPSVMLSTARGALNGYNNVTCAGIAAASAGSYRSLNGFVTAAG